MDNPCRVSFVFDFGLWKISSMKWISTRRKNIITHIYICICFIVKMHHMIQKTMIWMNIHVSNCSDTFLSEESLVFIASDLELQSCLTKTIHDLCLSRLFLVWYVSGSDRKYDLRKWSGTMSDEDQSRIQDDWWILFNLTQKDPSLW